MRISITVTSVCVCGSLRVAVDTKSIHEPRAAGHGAGLSGGSRVAREGHSKLRTHWVKATTQEGSILWQAAHAFKIAPPSILHPPLSTRHPSPATLRPLTSVVLGLCRVCICLCVYAEAWSDSVSKKCFWARLNTVGCLAARQVLLLFFCWGLVALGSWFGLARFGSVRTARLNFSGHAMPFLCVSLIFRFPFCWNLWMLLTLLIAATRRFWGLFSSASIQQRLPSPSPSPSQSLASSQVWGRGRFGSGLHVDIAQLKLTFRETSPGWKR